MSAIRSLDGLDVAGKRVLVRADLNVPVQDGKVTDTTRIDRLAPTVRELAGKGARVVLLSHFGRPKGQRVEKDSLEQIAPTVTKQIGVPVAFCHECIGPDAEKAVNGLKNGEVVLLENLRFHAGEEKNDPAFVAELAKLGDLYVDDAFSAAHRAHASIAGITEKLPAYAGRGMEAELTALDKALGNPAHPVAALVGGAKISTKLDLLQNLVAKVDLLVLGGGMANTFLAARGAAMGKSLVEGDMLDTAREIEKIAKDNNCTILLPVDALIAEKFGPGQSAETVPADKIPADRMMLDIGPASVDHIKAKLKTCRTVVWNGPMGAFEIPPFDSGTVAVAKTVAALTKDGTLISIGGGGDTVAALAAAGVEDDFTYISTAGGAFLEWMEGKVLPGVVPLMK
ncbi:MAG TPA: phosphoglycerate kinase [Alphaproteobacteria bacterium]|nr:phosphoglycerate kinase [Alphaproteobacteria bacterium]